MCRSVKLPLLFTVLLVVTLIACTPAATPAPPVPPTPTIPPPTPVPPTSTKPPLPTSTPVPTFTIQPQLTPGSIRGKFDAGGVKLYLKCLGEGSPTIVLDAGWGMDSSTWNNIMPKLRSNTRVCAYDRPNMGNSDKQKGLRTSQQIAEELHTLLASAKVEGPYVVVGHSLGGMNMLVFADRYQEEVAGVVLVDSAHPDQYREWSAILPTPAPGESADLADLRTGLSWTNPKDSSFPEPFSWSATLEQVRAVKSLGSIPLAVLVAVDPSKRGQGDIPPELVAGLDKIWLDLHKEYAALSTDSSLILAEHSGHFIQDDEPQVVIDAILGMVDKVRQK